MNEWEYDIHNEALKDSSFQHGFGVIPKLEKELQSLSEVDQYFTSEYADELRSKYGLILVPQDKISDALRHEMLFGTKSRGEKLTEEIQKKAGRKVELLDINRTAWCPMVNTHPAQEIPHVHLGSKRVDFLYFPSLKKITALAVFGNDQLLQNVSSIKEIKPACDCSHEDVELAEKVYEEVWPVWGEDDVDIATRLYMAIREHGASSHIHCINSEIHRQAKSARIPISPNEFGMISIGDQIKHSRDALNDSKRESKSFFRMGAV